MVHLARQLEVIVIKRLFQQDLLLLDASRAVLGGHVVVHDIGEIRRVNTKQGHDEDKGGGHLILLQIEIS